MKAICKKYKPTNNSLLIICKTKHCPITTIKQCRCNRGIIYIDWISYIKYKSSFDKLFVFEDIIYDEI